MKSVIYGLMALVMTSSAYASNSGYSASEAESAVVSEAHAFITRNAPDFGGSGDSPCDSELNGDGYTVTCSGIADQTVGGDGFTKISFSCVGHFDQGEDGLFYKSGSI